MDNSAQTPGKNPLLGPKGFLALLIGLALLIRIVAALTRPMIEMDESSYVRMAQNLAAGTAPFEITGTSATNFSPLFALLTAGVGAVLRDYVVSAYAIAVIFGSLLLLPVYLLAKELAGTRAGLMAAALVAVLPIYVDYSSRLYGENVYIFFLLMSIVFARHMLRGCRIPCSTLAGASLGLAYLANPSAVFYLGIYLTLAIIVAIRNGIVPQMAKAALVLILFFSLYAAPYALFLHSQLGQWTYQGKAPGNSYAAALGLRHNTLEWEQEMLALSDDGVDLRLYQIRDTADPAGNFLKDPGQALRNLGRQADYLYSVEAQTVLPLWLLPLMGLGLFASGWTRRRAAGVGYLLVMMLPLVFVLSVYNAYTRLFMPFVALVLVWVAQGWQKLEDWSAETVEITLGEAAKRRWQGRLRWAVAAAVILPLFFLSGTTVLGRDYPTGYREAGEFLKPTSGIDTGIMSRETSAAFYGGATLVLLPYADYDGVARYARDQEVDYLVISRSDIDARRPGLAGLKGPDEWLHPDWRLIATVQPGTAQETFIFELK